MERKYSFLSLDLVNTLDNIPRNKERENEYVKERYNNAMFFYILHTENGIPIIKRKNEETLIDHVKLYCNYDAIYLRHSSSIGIIIDDTLENQEISLVVDTIRIYAGGVQDKLSKLEEELSLIKNLEKDLSQVENKKPNEKQSWAYLENYRGKK